MALFFKHAENKEQPSNALLSNWHELPDAVLAKQLKEALGSDITFARRQQQIVINITKKLLHSSDYAAFSLAIAVLKSLSEVNANATSLLCNTFKEFGLDYEHAYNSSIPQQRFASALKQDTDATAELNASPSVSTSKN